MFLKKYLFGTFGIFLIFNIISCGSNEKKTTKAPPPPQVTVSKPIVQDITEYVYYTGNLQASKFVEIKSKVQGYLNKINFIDGTIVKKGDVLFEIDPKPFQAKLNQAIADYKVIQAELKLAKAKLKRKKIAYKTKAISEIELLQAEANVDVYNANLKKAQAAINSARLNLSDTIIRAPFEGRIGRKLIDEGNLVIPNQMVLTTIVKDDPIYAYVYMNEKDFLNYKKHNQYKEFINSNKNKVEIKFAESKSFDYSGYLDFMGNKINPSTGTIELRAVFTNKEHKILPGLYTEMRIPISFKKDALLIDEKAIGIDQRGEYLFTVDTQNIVQYKHIVTGPVIEGKKVVYSGINKDDKVIINGILRAKPGNKVTPVTPKQAEEMFKKASSNKSNQE